MNLTKILLFLSLQITTQYQYCKSINLWDKLQYSGYVIGAAAILYGHSLHSNPPKDIGRESQIALNHYIISNSGTDCLCETYNYTDDDFQNCGGICVRCDQVYQNNVVPLLKSIETQSNEPSKTKQSYTTMRNGAAILGANALYHLLIKLKSVYYQSFRM